MSVAMLTSALPPFHCVYPIIADTTRLFIVSGVPCAQRKLKDKDSTDGCLANVLIWSGDHKKAFSIILVFVNADGRVKWLKDGKPHPGFYFCVACNECIYPLDTPPNPVPQGMKGKTTWNSAIRHGATEHPCCLPEYAQGFEFKNHLIGYQPFSTACQYPNLHDHITRDEHKAALAVAQLRESQLPGSIRSAEPSLPPGVQSLSRYLLDASQLLPDAASWAAAASPSGYQGSTLASTHASVERGFAGRATAGSSLGGGGSAGAGAGAAGAAVGSGIDGGAAGGGSNGDGGPGHSALGGISTPLRPGASSLGGSEELMGVGGDALGVGGGAQGVGGGAQEQEKVVYNRSGVPFWWNECPVCMDKHGLMRCCVPGCENNWCKQAHIPWKGEGPFIWGWSEIECGRCDQYKHLLPRRRVWV